jgi:hypothetical protein
MAVGGKGMTHQSPPRWLQKLLSITLKSHDRQTIAGDLLEEYREERLPRFGIWRANYWYFCQILNIASIRVLGGQVMKAAWIGLSLFIAFAGIWLGVMENVLRHAGYEGRTIMDGGILLQSLATLLFVRLNGSVTFRALVLTGAALISLLGASAIVRILQSPHFEGFVLLIGLSLILQGCCTIAILLRMRHLPS